MMKCPPQTLRTLDCARPHRRRVWREGFRVPDAPNLISTAPRFSLPLSLGDTTPVRCGRWSKGTNRPPTAADHTAMLSHLVIEAQIWRLVRTRCRFRSIGDHLASPVCPARPVRGDVRDPSLTKHSRVRVSQSPSLRTSVHHSPVGLCSFFAPCEIHRRACDESAPKRPGRSMSRRHSQNGA
jgi:hypothetical protein